MSSPPADPPRGFLADNMFALALWAIFLVCVAGQAVTGVLAYNQDLSAAVLPKIGISSYLATGDFLDGLFSNWHAAILQLAVFLALGSKLRQRGSPHFRRTDSEREAQKAPPRQPHPAGQWLWANAFSVVFFVGFVVTFVAHGYFGELKHNEEQALRHLSSEGLGAYVTSSDFWRSVFQC